MSTEYVDVTFAVTGERLTDDERESLAVAFEAWCTAAGREPVTMATNPRDPAERDRQVAERAFDEAVRALAWAMANGPDPLAYVREHNPYRADSAAPDEREALVDAVVDRMRWAYSRPGDPMEPARLRRQAEEVVDLLAARPARVGRATDPLIVSAIRRHPNGTLRYEPANGPATGTSGRSFLAEYDAALAARPAPTVNAADVEITTAAELDALPAGTIVRDRFGGYLAQGRDAMGVAWFHYPVYDHAGSSALVAGIGPVTVCFTPGLTVADEGRADA